MKKLRIKITEKQKFIQSFNLSNFREEIVNFMYKKTVANSSKNSMIFYVLIFFLSLKINSKSLLRDLFDKNASKLKALSKKLPKKDKLIKGQYSRLVEECGLKDVFKYDIFFLLIYAVINSNKISSQFKDYFHKNPEIEKEFKTIADKYKDIFESFQIDFEKSLILDERLDYRGEVHDLSKSVNRTIVMRTSRRLDLPLHRYAELKTVTSSSPLSVEIIQYIKPELITHIWEIYKLDEYVKEIWNFVNNNAIVTGIVSGLVVNNADKWLKWRTIDGSKNRKAKTLAKIELDIARENEGQKKNQEDLIELLVKSTINSNAYLQQEILRLKAELTQKQKESSVIINRTKEIKELKERIVRLENVSIQVEEID